MRRVAIPQELALVAGLEAHQGPEKQLRTRRDQLGELEIPELGTLELGTLELAAALERVKRDFRPLKSFILKDARRGRESRY